MSVFITLIAALIVFSTVIAIHEFGHFAAAKLCGIQVNEFSIGMGPVLWKKTRKGTQYSLRALPVGGFVALEGEESPESQQAEAARDAQEQPAAENAGIPLNDAPVWQRALVMAAGAFMNFVLGFAVLLVLIILTFILSDLAEQGRRRVGILRALGVSGRSMLRTQLLLSMREALEAVLVANAVMAVVLLICACAETGWSTASPAALLAVLGKGLLWQYPWRLHGLLCLAAWALTTLLRTLPYRRLCKNSVIGTIKGLERGE